MRVARSLFAHAREGHESDRPHLLDATRGIELDLFDMNVAEVDLSGKYIGDSGAMALATVLPFSSVTTLNLAFNDIGDEG